MAYFWWNLAVKFNLTAFFLLSDIFCRNFDFFWFCGTFLIQKGLNNTLILNFRLTKKVFVYVIGM